MNNMKMRKVFGCLVRRLEYDFATSTGHIHLPKLHCCDMSKRIDYFTKIDEDVYRIINYSGGKKDIEYSRDESGKWEAEEYR